VKGIAHFVTGVAVATFFPDIVHGAAQSLSFGPALGGAAALLPDTLDFKFIRYFQRWDDEIDPAQITLDNGRSDPQGMAERIAAAVDRAHERGTRLHIHLHALRLAPDRWQPYGVTFDAARRQVVVRLAPLATAGQGASDARDLPDVNIGRAAVQVSFRPPERGEIWIGTFGGSSLAFEPADSRVRIVFLPWHRAWTHSLLAASLVGLLGSLWTPSHGLAFALALLAHALQDQLGHMGSNLLFPLTRRRRQGLGLFHSDNPLANLTTVWVGVALILFNLDRFSPAPVLPALPYLALAVGVPLLVAVIRLVWHQRPLVGPAGTTGAK
jgi:membrane-bound metal-dependent hydrolase YbcI (DUF457 family)